MATDLREAIAEWQQQFVRGGTDDIAGEDGQTYYYDYSELPERLERLLRRVYRCGEIDGGNDATGLGSEPQGPDAAIRDALEAQDDAE